MRHAMRFILLSLLTALAGCRSVGSTDTGVEPAIPVRMMTLQKEEWRKKVQASGILAASEQARLSFKIGGIIYEFCVKEGDTVCQGQILATLKLDEIEATIMQARSGYDKARRDYLRTRNLYADSVATLEQLQNAETAMQVTDAQKRIAEFNFEHARITAPEYGKILKQLAEPNELVAAGSPVFLFASGSKSWVINAGVTDKDVVNLAPGDSAEIHFDAYPEQCFKARIHEIAGAPDPMNGLYEVALRLESPQEKLMSGFVGTVLVMPSDRILVWRIPLGALAGPRQNEAAVFTVQDSHAVRIPVQIRHMDDHHAILSEGLEDVPRIVTAGTDYLKDGMKVRVMSGEAL